MATRVVFLAALVQGVQFGSQLHALSTADIHAEIAAVRAELARRDGADVRVAVDAHGELETAVTTRGNHKKGRGDGDDDEDEDDDTGTGGVSEFPADFDCNNWTMPGGGGKPKQIVLHSVRMKLIVPGSKAWARTKSLSNCDCMRDTGAAESSGALVNNNAVAECICRMVRTAENADSADFSLAETHGLSYDGSGSGVGDGGGNGTDSRRCPMKFTWSQYEQITKCDCTNCKYEKQGSQFISQCSNCDCSPHDTTKCIPGFFTIKDQPLIGNWSRAGDFFEYTMCVIRGKHPPEMCRKMRCEVFGGETIAAGATGTNGTAYCEGSSTWVNAAQPADLFKPDPAYCRILDVLKEAHFAHNVGIASITDGQATESVQEDLWASVPPAVTAAENAMNEYNEYFTAMGGVDPAYAEANAWATSSGPATAGLGAGPQPLQIGAVVTSGTSVRSSLAQKRAMHTLVKQRRHSPKGRMSLIQAEADMTMGGKCPSGTPAPDCV